MLDGLTVVRERLLTAGIAPRHARRYVAELRDHAADLVEEEMAAGLPPDEADARALSRLGGPDELVHAMVVRGDFRSWGVRAPWAVYGLGSLGGLAAAYALAVAILAGIIETHRPGWDAHPELPLWFDTAFAFIRYGTGVLAPPALGGLFALMATRQRMAVRWPTIALLIIAIAGAAGTWSFDPGDSHGSPMELGLTFGLSTVDSSLRHIVINLLLTLAPYIAWHVWQKAMARYSALEDEPGGPLVHG
ncbi:permease prefix domain 1-containing protein [Nitrospirillum iridis]|uniref:Uncharacterized protein n=1 Tax=Nitrospirillum iridis TaxID=765888 RepID=A0A7X0AXL1_9PROT|nr:permease prefix domain 1-containing protein [Nitrospirillum iridis]MBB6251992.1 hypothetical protein [Nitrospirillum iridis]